MSSLGPSSQPNTYHGNGERLQIEQWGVYSQLMIHCLLVFTSSLFSRRAWPPVTPINHRAQAESSRVPLRWLRQGLGHHKIHIKSEMGVLTPHSFPQCTSSASGYTAPSERLALLGVDVGFGLRPHRAASQPLCKQVCLNRSGASCLLRSPLAAHYFASEPLLLLALNSSVYTFCSVRYQSVHNHRPTNC